MPNTARGKQLFDARVEYPLPKIANTRDYIFYVPPDSDDYTKAAKRFFDKSRYPNHVQRQVNSLEEIIQLLHQDISGGINHVREVVIVVHGNATALQLPIFVNSPEGMRVVTASTLACLQTQLSSHTQFRDQRAAVVAKLTAGSWITLRVCRFGQALEGLYGLYSFFGGRADVYAPRNYQFFGDMSVQPGTRTVPTRYSTRLKYHDHMSRQHFFAGDMHTPERKDAIVRAVADPASFAEPFELARHHSDPPPPSYSEIIDGLNKSALSPAVRARFEDVGFPLTDKAVSRSLKGGWLIRDTVSHPDGDAKFAVIYRIFEDTNPHDDNVVLTGQAQLVGAAALQASVQIQLFLDEQSRADFDGRFLPPIALKNQIYTTDPPHDDPGTPDGNQQFDSTLALLRSFANGQRVTHDANSSKLRLLFADRGAELPDNAKVTRQTGVHKAKEVWWFEGSPIRIQLEEHVTSDTSQAQMLFAYLDLVEESLHEHQYEVVASRGANPDTPGVELPAYFSRLSIEELIDVIAYLRETYVPEHAFYIDHAQNAIGRKRLAYTKWSSSQVASEQRSPLYYDSLFMLNIREGEDKKATSYPFEFHVWWKSAKEEDMHPVAFQTDLFDLAVESLAERFKIDPMALCKHPIIDFQPDSPSTSKDALEGQVRGLDKFKKSNKRGDSFDKDMLMWAPSQSVSCDDFKKAIVKLKSLHGKPPDVIRDLMAKEKTAGGDSFMDVIDDLSDKYDDLSDIAALVEIELPSLPPTSLSDLAEEAGKFAIKHSGIHFLVMGLEVFEFVEGIVTVPLAMWGNFLDEQQKGADHWVVIGRLTAVRQYLGQLDALTFQTPIPDTIHVDVSTPIGGGSVALSRYRAEVGPTPVPLFMAELERGYADGLTKLDELQEKLLEGADQLANDIFVRLDLSECKVKALQDAGLADLKRTRMRALDAIARELLDQLPKLR